MTSPLAPPPPTGNSIDRWLYLLWRKLTATGQLFWSSIAPGTSADVAGAVTDETGSPGALVFATNPTLTGVTVNGVFYQGDTTVPAGSNFNVLSGMFSTDTAVGASVTFRKCVTASNGVNNYFMKSRGSAASPAAIVTGDVLGSVSFCGFDGTNYIVSGILRATSEGAISAGVVPSHLKMLTTNSSGVSSEGMRVDSAQTVTLGGASTAPALSVIPAASQNRAVTITGSNSGNPTIGVSGGSLACSAALVLSQTTLLETSVALTNGAAAAIGTLLNAPAAGNPTKWIPINDNGTVRYIPAW